MSGASPRDPFSPVTSTFNVRATTKTYSLDVFIIIIISSNSSSSNYIIINILLIIVNDKAIN